MRVSPEGGVAIDLLFEIGLENVANRVLSLTAQLVEGLEDHAARIASPRGDGYASCIVAFNLEAEGTSRTTANDIHPDGCTSPSASRNSQQIGGHSLRWTETPSRKRPTHRHAPTHPVRIERTFEKTKHFRFTNGLKRAYHPPDSKAASPTWLLLLLPPRWIEAFEWGGPKFGRSPSLGEKP